MTCKTLLDKGRGITLQPRLLSALEQVGPVAMHTMGQVVIEQSNWRGETGALAGATIEIAGLRALPIEVIIKVALEDGSEHSAVFRLTIITMDSTDSGHGLERRGLLLAGRHRSYP
jgi:hypothetical protein